MCLEMAERKDRLRILLGPVKISMILYKFSGLGADVSFIFPEFPLHLLDAFSYPSTESRNRQTAAMPELSPYSVESVLFVPLPLVFL